MSGDEIDLHERELWQAAVEETIRGMSDQDFARLVASTRPPTQSNEIYRSDPQAHWTQNYNSLNVSMLEKAAQLAGLSNLQPSIDLAAPDDGADQTPPPPAGWSAASPVRTPTRGIGTSPDAPNFADLEGTARENAVGQSMADKLASFADTSDMMRANEATAARRAQRHAAFTDTTDDTPQPAQPNGFSSNRAQGSHDQAPLPQSAQNRIFYDQHRA